METEYRGIAGFPGYRIGSDGSVWTCKTYKAHGYRYGFSVLLTENWRQLSPGRSGSRGYLGVTLCRNNRKYSRRINVLVLETFVGPRPEGMHAAHEDGNIFNNALSNLSWKTVRDNCADKIRHGTYSCGEHHPRSKLSSAAVERIRREPDSLGTATRLAIEFGVSATHIRRIRKGVCRVLGDEGKEYHQ